jgi:hypothetical protein
MSSAKRNDLPRLDYGRAEAAAIVGVGTDLFDRAVAAGTMPQPRVLGGRLLWDIGELVRAFRELPHRGAQTNDIDDDLI